MTRINKIKPFLWFESHAREAAEFYVEIFENSKILSIEELSSGPGEGSVVVEFELEGVVFTALDGGPMYKITPAVSFMVNCDSQEEIDHFWEKLRDGGNPMQCGWVEDRFGVTWQIVPSALPELIEAAPDAVMGVLLKMVKIEIEPLRRAAERD